MEAPPEGATAEASSRGTIEEQSRAGLGSLAGLEPGGGLVGARGGWVAWGGLTCGMRIGVAKWLRNQTARSVWDATGLLEPS